MPTVSMQLNTNSIRRAIRELRAYQTRLHQAASEIARRLVDEVGLPVASVRFASAQYDGKNDVVVSAEPTATGYRLVAEGKAVCFIEFGTGVHYNTGTSYPLPKPAGITPIGAYGHGRGSHDTWRYHGDPGTNGVVMTPADDPTVKEPYVLTQGNPANMPMFLASDEMRMEVERIAREVLHP